MIQNPGETDLVLAIELLPSGDHRTVVLSGGARVEAPFEAPFEAEEVRKVLASLAQRISSDRSRVEADSREVVVRGLAQASDHRAFGVRLYEALFRDRVRDVFMKSLARHEASSGGRLRLRLAFGLGDGRSDSIAALPWELLCSPDDGQFLVLGERISLLRELHVDTAKSTRTLHRPFRVLAAGAQPAGTGPLNLAREWRLLHREIDRSPDVEIEEFTGASINALRERLEEGRFNALHFMGHGDVDLDKGTGYLFFDRDGLSHSISGDHLATNLRDLPDLQLTVLNACHSGSTGGAIGGKANSDPYLGVAASLIRSGQVAVIAMQAAVPDVAAIRFSQGFYRALVRGKDVETALYQGRLRILNELGDRSGAWAIPTLVAPPGGIGGVWGSASPIEREDTGSSVEPSIVHAIEPQGSAARKARWVVIASVLVFVIMTTIWAAGVMPGLDFGGSAPDDFTGPSDRSVDVSSDDVVSEPSTGAVDDPSVADSQPSTNSSATRSGSQPQPPPTAGLTQPKSNTSPLSERVPGRMGVVFLDQATGAVERSLTSTAVSVAGSSLTGYSPRQLSIDPRIAESVRLGDLSLIGSGDKTLGGSDWLLIGTGSVEPSMSSGLHTVHLTIDAVLISTSSGEVEHRIFETHTGRAASASGALRQASERCLESALDHLQQGT